MRISGSLKRILSAIALCVPLVCVAGRPVFRDLSLSELTQSSKLIAIVTKAPTATAVKGAYGCESLEWRLSIISILRATAGVQVEPGNAIGIRLNVTSYEDCVLRKGWSTTGASFAASRYTPSLMTAPQQERFIVFLAPSDLGFRLTADMGFESIARKSEIENLLNGQR